MMNRSDANDDFIFYQSEGPDEILHNCVLTFSPLHSYVCLHLIATKGLSFGFSRNSYQIWRR